MKSEIELRLPENNAARTIPKNTTASITAEPPANETRRDLRSEEGDFLLNEWARGKIRKIFIWWKRTPMPAMIEALRISPQSVFFLKLSSNCDKKTSTRVLRNRAVEYWLGVVEKNQTPEENENKRAHVITVTGLRFTEWRRYKKVANVNTPPIMETI
jgi:hypothetical protein